jgi:integrase
LVLSWVQKCPRTIHDARLETRAARARLRPRKKPYVKTLIPGRLALGYRRIKADVPGRWVARIYLGNEQYRITSLGIADDFADAASGHVLSYAEAQSCALALKTDTRRHDGATVEDAIAAHVQWMAVDRPLAAAEFNAKAECHILPRLGAIPLVALTTEQIVAWRDALVAAPAYHARRPYPTSEDGRRARRASVNRVWTCLRAALNRAFEAGMVESNTAWKRVRPLRNTNAARQRFLTVEEARRLINAADAASGFRALMHAALLTGCRYGELCKLDVQDFRHNKLHVLRSKSGRERWIVLTEEGIAFFAALTAGRAGHEPLLRRNGERWRKDQQQAPTAKACVAARLTPRITFHGMRHSYASLCIMAGMPMMVLAQNLGHCDVTMVTRHYGHLESSFVDAEIKRAAPRFGLVGKGNIRALRPKARANE